MTDPSPTGEAQPPPGALVAVALVLVVPFYLLVGWLLDNWLDEQPVLPETQHLWCFGLACAIGLGAAVASFAVRNALSRRDGTSMKPMLFALGLAETPGVLGIVYLVLCRDLLGFGLLVSAMALAFVAHARPRPAS